ncbi:MAG: lipoyl(octanoyl) transferase LipB [Chloroflexi bacterium]|nr:lipoyl(octanoyl) transferase LipB [Chloroflexota bacterium]MDA1239354.1 lipoyl(octanoyl) transferase LipB [Chloroflexota bacterium]
MTPETALRRALVACVRATGVDYAAGLRWQRTAASTLRSGEGRESLALIEHASVYTAGARAGLQSLRVERDRLRAPLVEADRGGDITWHGPGQIVGYPVLDLRARGLKAGDYIRSLERVIIAALAELGHAGEVVDGRPGVWVDGAKVAAVGVRVRDGVSQHGFALNVDADLRWFDDIVPCGIADAAVTSVATLSATPVSIERVVEAVRAAFVAEFFVTLIGAENWNAQARAVEAWVAERWG